MSELTSCNYCDYQRLLARAKKEGATIHKRNSKFMGGIDIFKVPKGESFPDDKNMIQPCEEYPNGNDTYNKYHIAWFMELPSHCCC